MVAGSQSAKNTPGINGPTGKRVECSIPEEWALDSLVHERGSMGRPHRWLLLAVVALSASIAATQVTPSAEQRAGRYLESIRQQPSLVLAFLHEMPKGGDLHNHLGGALYAENLIDYAVDDGLCIDRTTSILIAPPCDATCDKYSSKPGVRCAYLDHVLYNSIVDAWSMRNWRPGDESGHDRFFSTFEKFSLATTNHTASALAEAISRAAADHLEYVEFMQTADGGQSAQLGEKLGWDDDFVKMRERLLAGGLSDIVTATRKQVDEDEAKVRSTLRCGTPGAGVGCKVNVRYLYQVLRGLPRQSVFAQILFGFELAQADPRFVGLNLVMPEDWYVPMHDFDLHMRMLAYLHGVYPKVHISLHAGELAMGLVPPDGLSFHIRESVEQGHAERIGHGADVMNENDALELLHEMAQRNVLVEICLTSNDLILGIKDNDHPLPVYLRYGVPVALATDDEGISRSDMTHEYLRAAETYHLSYAVLKNMARQSLEHSFLPGASLWTDFKAIHTVSACAADSRSGSQLSAACQKFLESNERARLQWNLETEFAGFERKF
jgi:adenosine deaminase